MGSVFKARHARLGRMVALKVLPAEMMQHGPSVARFEREMQAAGQLQHPNVVQAFDAGDVDGIPYLVMEFVDGENLQQYVERRGPLPITESCRFIQEAAEGLGAAHAIGLIHRDIKPLNLFITHNGQLKILDLGLARFVQEDLHSLGLTGKGDCFGTVDYMPPEQWEDAHDCDSRSDLYALGCTLYFVLTGQPPFSGDGYSTVPSKMRGHMNAAPPDLRSIRPDVPEGLALIGRKLLAKQPAKRFQSAAELVDALSEWSGEAADLPDHSARKSTGKRRATSHRRYQLVGITTGICVLGGVLFLMLGDGLVPRVQQDQAPPAETASSENPESSTQIVEESAPDSRMPEELEVAAVEPTTTAAEPTIVAADPTATESKSTESTGADTTPGDSDTMPAKSNTTPTESKPIPIESSATPTVASPPEKDNVPTEPTQPPVEIKRTVVISSEPPGANIFLNDEMLGIETDAEYELAPGRYRLRLATIEYLDPPEREVVIEAGEGKQVLKSIKLEPLLIEDADYDRGTELFWGTGEQVDQAAGISFLLKAAERKHPLAMAHVASFYFLGNHQQVSKDREKAARLVQRARPRLEKLASNGDARAQQLLGQIYNYGIGVQQDQTRAVEWFRKAADQDCAIAQGNLGSSYEHGQGVNQDNAEAAVWFRKAADQNLALAQNHLGWMYQHGVGMTKDSVEAAEWYRKAAEQNLALAQNNLGLMYQYGYGVSKNPAEAAVWYRKAAEQDFASAQNHLGLMYQHGTGVTKDLAEAIKWFRKAAEQDFAAAQGNLGLSYEQGLGVDQDHAEAVAWYRKAADQNLALAQNNLGRMYQQGLGVKKDAAEAVVWYRKAADQDHSLGQFNLGWMYQTGQGVDKDPAEAINWYRKVIANPNAGQKEKKTATERITALSKKP